MNDLKLIFATHNLNKFNEIKKMIPHGIKVQSLTDLNFILRFQKTKTIEKNAIFKAKFIYSKFNSTVFADDTGLEVDSLNGKPGVHSARYAGIKRDSTKNNEKLLFELSGIENRKANFKTIISLVHNGKVYLFEGKIVGKIALSQRDLTDLDTILYLFPMAIKKHLAN